MEIDESELTQIVNTYYGITAKNGRFIPLHGYVDENFTFGDSSDKGSWYHLKIVNKDESKPELTDIIDEVVDNFYNYCEANSDRLLITAAKLIRTSGNKLSAYTDIRYKTACGSTGAIKCNIKVFTRCHAYAVRDLLLYEIEYPEKEIFFDMGKICGQLSEFLTNQGHLREKLRQTRGEQFRWQVTTCDQVIESNLQLLFPHGGDQLNKKQSRRWKLANRVLNEYKGSIKAKLLDLPECIIHSDLSTWNILKEATIPEVRYCIIDFADLQVDPKCVELAHSMLFSVLEQYLRDNKEAIKQIPHWVYKGYHSNAGCSIDDEELSLIPGLMKVRLCQSLLNGLVAIRRDPKNGHVMETDTRGGWKLLEVLIYQDTEELIDCWKNGPPK